MKYGEALRAVFEAMYKDRSSVDTTYTAPNLKAIVQTLPPQWKRELMKDFQCISNELERNILSCPHPADAIKKPYDTCEECTKCGAKRFYELEDNDPNSWNERKIWSAWKVF